jgi:hypothetical protein
MPPPPFRDSAREYERWLSAHLDDTWKADVDEKHRKMRESPFVFLRATYWRWAEVILTACGELVDAPLVTGVGDIHLENYGVWRDREGRLVWGVNDLDEAAEMPYVLDLVRLAASAVLSRSTTGADREEIYANILRGYGKGLANPRPFTLDEDHAWLRTLFAVSERERAEFWKKIDRLTAARDIPRRYREPMERAMPDIDVDVEKFARRSAGTGSLGRPRWVAVATWRGGRLVREAKAVLPSAWTLAHPVRSDTRGMAAVAAGRYRSPDPWFYVGNHVVVRRLSPNARKIEAEDHPESLKDGDLLRAMARELANVHVGAANLNEAIASDLERRPDGWLRRASERAAEFVIDDFEAWRR